MDGTILVTGSTGGIGYFAAEQLARQGHRVLLAARDPVKATAATAAVRRHVPAADVEAIPLDLADLASIATAAARLSEGPPLAAIIANAAVVSYGLRPTPPRRTADGFELHFGTAHLGHYALIIRLLPQLQRWGTRVVHVSSLSHRLPLGGRPWSSAEQPRREPTLLAYARSKCAVTLFGLELARRFAQLGSSAASAVAHPGMAVDVLTPTRDGIPPSQPTDLNAVARLLVRSMHGKDGGARILVHAATSAAVRNGDLWGPGGPAQLSGDPVRLRPPHILGADRVTADLLRVSAELTGVG